MNKIFSSDVTRNIIEVAGIQLNFSNRTVTYEHHLIETTGLEFNLLAMLMAESGSVVTREAIAETIFNQALSQCSKSMNSHMTNIRKKFSSFSTQPVIKTVRGQGYIFLTA